MRIQHTCSVRPARKQGIRELTITRWRGRELRRNVEAAAVEAMDKTLAEEAKRAPTRAPVDTGRLRSSIGVIEPAHVEDNAVVGKYGSQGAPLCATRRIREVRHLREAIHGQDQESDPEAAARLVQPRRERIQARGQSL
jgi:hypothetical protein